MKVLINAPNLSSLGGVSNHFLGLKSHWKSNIEHNVVGSRFKISGFIFLPFDILIFIYKIIAFGPDLILLNPSLNPKSYYRDYIYLCIAKFFFKKVIVFFHGWEPDFEDKLNKSPLRKLYYKADAIIVLAKAFKFKLLSWGYTNHIFLSTTKVEESFILKSPIRRKTNWIHILFFGRIEKEKGIFIALETFKSLSIKHINITLDVVGDGSELNNAVSYCKNNSIKNVNFHGRLIGVELKAVLKKCHINLFPTSHGEGMPTSVLESMAFGHAIVTRPVGGLVDFFESGKMGFFVNSLSPDNFVNAVDQLIENTNLLTEMEIFNYTFAKQNFSSSMVSKQLESYFKEVIA